MGRVHNSYARFLCLVCLTFLSFLLTPSAVPAQGNGGVVTGQIRLPDGSPAARIRVSAMSANATAAGAGVLLESLAETDLSGRYLLSGISPGRYYIIAGALDAPTYFPGVDSARTARVLEIADGSSVDSVNFIVQRLRASPPGSVQSPVSPGITGKVLMEGGTRLPGFLPRLYVDVGKANRRTAIGEDGTRIRGSGTFGAVAVSKNGSFWLLVADGDYDVSLITSLGEPLTSDDGYYVKSIVSGSMDLTKQKLAVRGRTAPAITITLAAGVRPER
jgi:hypothetical protein